MSELVPYQLLLAIWVATHALVGYTLGQFLFDRPWVGLGGAIAADLDFLFPAMLEWPFVHRGITHTILVGTLLTAILAYRDESIGAVFGAGYATHLLIDMTTPKGVPLLYPLTDASFYVDLGTTGHSPGPTVAFWIGCLGLLWYYGHLPTLERFTGAS